MTARFLVDGFRPLTACVLWLNRRFALSNLSEIAAVHEFESGPSRPILRCNRMSAPGGITTHRWSAPAEGPIAITAGYGRQVRMLARSVLRNFLSCLMYHSQLMALLRVLRRSE